jgi:hypothetical protein
VLFVSNNLKTILERFFFKGTPNKWYFKVSVIPTISQHSLPFLPFNSARPSKQKKLPLSVCLICGICCMFIMFYLECKGSYDLPFSLYNLTFYRSYLVLGDCFLLFTCIFLKQEGYCYYQG